DATATARRFGKSFRRCGTRSTRGRKSGSWALSRTTKPCAGALVGPPSSPSSAINRCMCSIRRSAPGSGGTARIGGRLTPKKVRSSCIGTSPAPARARFWSPRKKPSKTSSIARSDNTCRVVSHYIPFITHRSRRGGAGHKFCNTQRIMKNPLPYLMLAVWLCSACSTSADQTPASTAAPQQTQAQTKMPEGQNINSDAKLMADFTAKVDDYLKLRKGLEDNAPPIKTTNNPQELIGAQKALAAQVRAARADAKRGDFFTPATQALFRRLLSPSTKGPEGPENKNAIR